MSENNPQLNAQMPADAPNNPPAAPYVPQAPVVNNGQFAPNAVPAVPQQYQGAPVNAQGMPANGQYAPAPYQYAPGAPVPGAPNPVGAAFIAQWTALKNIFAGKLGEAFKSIESVKLAWLIPILGSCLFFAFYAGISILVMQNSGSEMSSLFSAIFGLLFNGNGFFTVFFTAFLSGAVIFFGRSLAIFIVLKIKKSSLGYVAAAQIMATSLIPMLCISVVLVIVSAIPVLNVFVPGVLLPMALLMSELIIYVGINRSGKFQKSPFMPHILVTAGYLVVVYIYFFILTAILASIAMNNMYGNLSDLSNFM